MVKLRTGAVALYGVMIVAASGCASPSVGDAVPDVSRAGRVADGPSGGGPGALSEVASDDPSGRDASIEDEGGDVSLEDGGVLVVLEADDPGQLEVVAQAVRSRLEQFGAPFSVEIHGDRITVAVATDDPARAQTLLESGGTLQAALVHGVEPLGTSGTDGRCSLDDEPVCGTDGDVAYELGARVDLGTPVSVSVPDGRGVVALVLADEVVFDWRELTAEAACLRDAGAGGQVALLVGEQVVSAPNMSQGVICGEGLAGAEISITLGGRDADQEDAQRLADLLRNAYPDGVRVVQVDTVAS